MPKIYIDWNIYSGLRNGKYPELLQILETSSHLDLLYSINHVSDVKKSLYNEKENPFLKKDLEFLSKLTKDHCIFRHLNGEIQLGYQNPTIYFESLIEQDNLMDDLSIENLLNDLNVPEYKIWYDMIVDLFNSFEIDDEIFKVINPKYYPAIARNKDLNDLLRASGKLYSDLVHTEEYKRLRNQYQTLGINSSFFKPNEDPFKKIEDILKRNAQTLPINGFVKRDNDAWFDEIIHKYLILDLSGYKSDKIKVNEKTSNTYLNILNDANHTAFASRCEFYITNDQKNIEKAKATYSHLNICTKVFKPLEFITYYNSYLSLTYFEDSYSKIRNRTCET